MKRIAVIGGGVAGMTAAIFAAGSGAEVTILEQKDRVGKKKYCLQEMDGVILRIFIRRRTVIVPTTLNFRGVS